MLSKYVLEFSPTSHDYIGLIPVEMIWQTPSSAVSSQLPGYVKKGSLTQYK